MMWSAVGGDNARRRVIDWRAEMVMTTFSTRCVLLAALPREELVVRLADEYQVVAGLTARVARRASRTRPCPYDTRHAVCAPSPYRVPGQCLTAEQYRLNVS